MDRETVQSFRAAVAKTDLFHAQSVTALQDEVALVAAFVQQRQIGGFALSFPIETTGSNSDDAEQKTDFQWKPDGDHCRI